MPMIPERRDTLRQVAWSDLFPWLLLLRTFWLAKDVRKLLLAAGGIVLTAAGWWLIAVLFLEEPDRPLAWPWNYGATLPEPIQGDGAGAEGGISRLEVPWRGTWRAFEANLLWLIGPFTRLLTGPLEVVALAAALLMALWGVAVWALVAGAITRMAALELALEERPGFRSALSYGRRKWRHYFAAPLTPLVFIVLVALPLALLGLVMRLDLGLVVAGLVWPLVLLVGLVMMLAVVGLLLGWPLMWPAISADEGDNFDAVSRSFSYVFQRPLHYLFYALVAALVGVAAWLVVATLANLLLHVTHWAVAWGSGAERIALVEAAARFPPGDVLELTEESSPAGAAGRFGLVLISIWTAVVRLVVLAYGYSFFWTAATAMYFLLRQAADGAELDEVYLEERPDQRGLPRLKTDEAGVPVLDETEPHTAPPGESPPGGPTPPAPPDEPRS